MWLFQLAVLLSKAHHFSSLNFKLGNSEASAHASPSGSFQAGENRPTKWSVNEICPAPSRSGDQVPVLGNRGDRDHC